MTDITAIVFPVLWRSSWQLLLLFAVVWALLKLNRTVNPVFSYILWIVVLIKGLLPIQIQTNLSVSPFPQSVFAIPNPLINTDAIQNGLSALPWDILIVGIWLTGVTVFGIWLIINEFRFRKGLRKAQSWSSNKGLDTLRQKMKVNRSIQLYVLSSLRIPFTRGIIQPKIYLPGEARHWTVSELEGVLAHEIAHIKRFDVLIIYLQTLSKIFYFFHPAIWWINHLLDLERERICDDMAIETVGLDRWQYGHDLFSRLEQSLQNPQAPLLASGFLISKKKFIPPF